MIDITCRMRCTKAIALATWKEIAAIQHLQKHNPEYQHVANLLANHEMLTQGAGT